MEVGAVVVVITGRGAVGVTGGGGVMTAFGGQLSHYHRMSLLQCAPILQVGRQVQEWL